MSDDVVGADQTLLPSLPLPDIPVEVLAEKEGVGHLHLPVRGEAGTLVDEVLLLLLRINLDQTLLSARSIAGRKYINI